MAVISSRFIAGLERGGVDIDRHVAKLYQDMTFGYGIITEQVKSGKSYGLNADQLLNILQIIIPADYLWDSIDTYLTVQHFADEIMKAGGLTLLAMEYEYYYEGYDALVRRELKERGAKYISVVDNPISKTVSVSVDMCSDMAAYYDFTDSIMEEIYMSVSEAVSVALYYKAIESNTYDFEGDWDFGDILRTMERYIDIFHAFSKESVDEMDKHERDIYFANRALTGDVVYMTEDIAVEVERLYHYLYEGIDELFEMLEFVLNGMEYSCSLHDYSSIEEAIYDIKDRIFEDYYCLSYTPKDIDCEWASGGYYTEDL